MAPVCPDIVCRGVSAAKQIYIHHDLVACRHPPELVACCLREKLNLAFLVDGYIKCPITDDDMLVACRLDSEIPLSLWRMVQAKQLRP